MKKSVKEETCAISEEVLTKTKKTCFKNLQKYFFNVLQKVHKKFTKKLNYGILPRITIICQKITNLM
jgi:hypothetical protein